jgi:hypothetical protein
LSTITAAYDSTLSYTDVAANFATVYLSVYGPIDATQQATDESTNCLSVRQAKPATL